MKPDQAHLAALIAIIQHNLRNTIVEHLNGQPRAQAYDSDRTSSGAGPSDPTYTAAVTPDRARTDLELHDQAADRAYRALLTLAGLSDKYLPTHEPRRGTMLAETRGCLWHQQAGVEKHEPAWRTSDCGFLNDAVPLCRPCHQYAHEHGTRPTNEQIIRHARGKGWTQRTTGKRTTAFSVEQVADFKPGGTAA